MAGSYADNNVQALRSELGAKIIARDKMLRDYQQRAGDQLYSWFGDNEEGDLPCTAYRGGKVAHSGGTMQRCRAIMARH